MDFVVNPQQRTLSKNLQAISLSKKSFDLLVVLLQSHGDLITKEELLAAVWPNQFITDSALNKQIARVRSALDSEESTESVIETIRGVGVRLVTDVQISRAKINSNKPITKYLVVACLLLAFSFIIYLILKQGSSETSQRVPETSQNYQSKTFELDNPSKELINIAIVPAEKTDDWLDIGGLGYLSELLQQHKEIDSISPQSDWFKQDESEVLALQLSQQENIDFALLIKNFKQDNAFISQIVLRNKHGILASGELSATTLANLFKKIDAWTIQQLNITSGVVFAASEQTSKFSDYTLESYLRGLAAARNRQFKKAAQFLQTAINQKKSFFAAWLLLAEVEAELGNFQKSLATTEIIEKLNDFDENYLNDLYNVKARTLIYLNKLDEARLYLNKSRKISEQQKDMKAIIISLSSQAMIQDRTGISDETLKIISKQLALVKKYNPLPSLVAQLNHNLAIVNRQLFKYDEAKKHISRAIKQYLILENYTGLVSSYRVKSEIYNDIAETGQALLAIEKANKWLSKVDSPITLTHYYASRARNLYEQGYFTLANAEIDNLHGISIKYDNLEAKVMALTIQTELQITYKKFTDAKNSIQQLLEIIKANPADYPGYAEYIVTLDMYLSALNDKALIARKKMNDYLKAYPDLTETLSHQLTRIEALIFASEGYRNKAATMLQKEMEFHIGISHFLDAIYIGYEILEIQWQKDMDGYAKTLNRVQEMTTFPYPILKFRAQYLAFQNDFLDAAILMQELKSKAREFWTNDDQLLMEEYQKHAKDIDLQS